MDTTKQTTNEAYRAKVESLSERGVDTWFAEQAKKFEDSRFFWMSVYMTLQSCLGAAACMFILQNKASDVVLAACAAITMGCNAVLIAQGPGKWCLSSFYLSMVLNTAFIAFNF